MKQLIRGILIAISGLALTFVLLFALALWQMNMLTRAGIKEAVAFISEYPPSAVVAILRMELGLMGDVEADPSYGRKLVNGRGHAPWVIRGNLDDHPRMLSFALAPEVWAAYDTESASLYQLWRGDILFEGSVYDYRHGPQPGSSGTYFQRHETPAQWAIVSGEQALPATVHYLGHSYGQERATASFSFELVAGDVSATLVETPELVAKDGTQIFERRISVTSEQPGIEVVMHAANGQSNRLALGGNVLSTNLVNGTPIPQPGDGLDPATGSDLDKGKQIILNSDCVGCHHETQQIVGPAFARIGKRFLGKMQQEPMEAMARSIINGSSGKWGEVPMPPHPDMSYEDALLSVTYIMSLSDLEAEEDIPLDEQGREYASTTEYDVGERLTSLHPAFTLDDLAPDGFQPKVGGLDFRADGKLLVASWDRDGAVFLVDPAAPMDSRVTRIAEGLQEPLGLKVVDDRIFVLQKQEVTELIDTDGDEIIDEYRALARGWPTSTNFHSFAFGLAHQDGYLYALLSICVQPGGASCADQLPTQGKAIRISLADGSVETYASGFRTPNGIAQDAEQRLFVTDNQGDWLPANKLVHLEAGKFYGSRAVPDEGVMEAVETPPVVWLPQDEIGNSPTQPAALTEGPYAGQLIHGDVYHGGIKRVYFEEVNGALQGAVFRFSAGFLGSVNRIVRGPDGDLYLGEIGNPPNWGEFEKAWYGLERLSYLGQPAYELLRVNATPDGFSLTLTEPLADGITPGIADLIARQWFYYPTEQYGGPKYDPTELQVAAISLSEDRRRIDATIPGLKAGYVVYLALDPRLKSSTGKDLWTHEAWYTLNNIPTASNLSPLSDSTEVPPNTLSAAEEAAGWQLLFDGENFGEWRNYGSREPVQKWLVEDGTLTLPGTTLGYLQSIANWVFGGPAGDLIYGGQKFKDFELRLEWKISENGNSGIFYFVADEEHNNPWETGLEMQVLHNEGHPDGQIEKHRAGDLYDLIAASPETVKAPGEWNEVLIRVKDRQVEHWLNGVKVVSFTHGNAAWDAMVAASKFSDMPDFGKSDTGYIVLQDHGDRVWFRNIKARAL